jgi:hypothetical protein
MGPEREKFLLLIADQWEQLAAETEAKLAKASNENGR